jgi:ABC-type polysaccharide/polyol phosphate export permease
MRGDLAVQAPRCARREDSRVVARRTPLIDDRLIDVVRVLFAQSVKLRYRGSVLGVVWSALSPLAMAAVYASVFGRTFARYYGDSVLLYAAAVYIGLALIGFFIAATTECSTTIVQNGGLLNKIRIPFEAFPLASIAAQAFQLLAGCVSVMVVLSLLMTHDLLHVVLLFVPLASLLMLATGVGLIISGVGAFFRDTPHLYELATFLLWVTSPIFYPVAIVPPRLQQVLVFNPLFPILTSARDLVLTPSLPPLWMFVVPLAEGVVVLVLGVAAFRQMRGHFMDHV